MTDLPNEITIQRNDSNGAPYVGYDGGEGVVYVRKDIFRELQMELISARAENQMLMEKNDPA